MRLFRLILQILSVDRDRGPEKYYKNIYNPGIITNTGINCKTTIANKNRKGFLLS